MVLNSFFSKFLHFIVAIIDKSTTACSLFSLYPSIFYCSQPSAARLQENKDVCTKKSYKNWKLTILHFVVIITCSYSLWKQVFYYNSPQISSNLNLLTFFFAFLNFILWSFTEDLLWQVDIFSYRQITWVVFKNE